ncbi:VanZ family protein [Agaribacterium sp. ZY112]|uniref:VanZ family protein n=1 Tax=Agaribacterium sp. ZY112 TaxID=3233574 RepID=UPI003525689B
MLIFTCISYAIYLANTGDKNTLFDIIATIPYGDKFGHSILYGSLTYSIIIASRFRVIKTGRIRLYYGVLFASLFSITEEISQLFIQSRTFDISDLIADLLGISIATLIAIKYRQVKRHA